MQPELVLTDTETGLTSSYVAKHVSKRKKNSGGNFKLVKDVLIAQVSSIFFVLLLVSAGLSFWLGSIIDGWIFIVINTANVVLGFIQEFRASKASKLLEDLIDHSASVIRDGVLVKVPSSEIVAGDIIKLSPGDVLVADVLVRASVDSYIDESILTGESKPIHVKDNTVLKAGSSVVSGTITAQATASNAENSLTKYANKLDAIKKNNSFAAFVSKISMNILLLTLFSILLVGVFGVVISHTYSVTDFILYAISMLVGVVPESLPLIITLMLTREALALSKEQVLVKRLSALQQLGSIKYLLTDKTGTLTENKVRLADMLNEAGIKDVSAKIAESEYERTPMDAAFDNAILQSIAESKSTSANKVLKPVVTPFKSAVGYASFVFPDIEIIRGQYAAVVGVSAEVTVEEKDKLQKIYEGYESQGLRVVAVASRKTGLAGYTFNGFLVFEDPLKPDAPHSYKAAEGLGISVKVLTGDSPLVALYIAKKLDSTFTEKEVCSLDTFSLDTLNDADFAEDKVYARCQPEQKLALIDMHLKHGAVGFLGEGINDALALKRADVGMVVYNASDVARQSADILLTEKSLNPVIKAIQMSRRVYAHIFTYLLCTLTGNLGTLFSLTAVTLFWKDLPMLPVQILLNNLLTDVPLILLITDHLSKTAYNKPIDHSPRELFKLMIIFALISSAFDMTYFFLFKNEPIGILRTGWFVFSVLCELILVVSLRTPLVAWKAQPLSRPLVIALSLCAGLAVALPYIPFVGTAFSLKVLSLSNLALLLGLVLIYFTINELYKYISRIQKVRYTS